MLKILPPAIIGNQINAKCGEIFCHSSDEFTIYCTFCEMKSFTFDDFLLHLQNVHFENNLLKTETFQNENSECTVNVKTESFLDPVDPIYAADIWNTAERPLDEEELYSGNDYNDGDDSCEEEPISVLKIQRAEKKARKYRKVKIEEDSGGEDEENGHSSDEEHKPVRESRPLSSAGTDERPEPCALCDKHFRNAVHLKIHIAKVHNDNEKKKSDEEKEKEDSKEQPCEECDKILLNRKVLDRHIVDEHGGFKCACCNKRFKQRHQRKRHEQSHTAERIYTCNVAGCGKSFTEKYYLKRHIDVHTTDRNFVCEFESCGKAFHTMRRLRAHQNIHTKPKNLVCDACGYTCRENETLRVHQRVHTGEKPYACDICDKRFISSSALGEHMASHSTTRPHVCKVCNASFARQKALYHHSFLHSDIKKFKCKVCGSAYKQASGLAGHMRKHREEGMMSMIPDAPPQTDSPNYQASVLPVAPAYPFITF